MVHSTIPRVWAYPLRFYKNSQKSQTMALGFQPQGLQKLTTENNYVYCHISISNTKKKNLHSNYLNQFLEKNPLLFY